MGLAHGDAVVAQCRCQILHGQSVFAVLACFRIGLGAMTGGGRIAGACLAMLERIVGHIRDEFLRGNRNQADAEYETNECLLIFTELAYHSLTIYTYIRGSDASKPAEFK